METILILGAAAIFVLALAVIAAGAARGRRPPLRTQREVDLEDGDEQGLLATLAPARASPIDRGATDLEALRATTEEARLLGHRAAPGHPAQEATAGAPPERMVRVDAGLPADFGAVPSRPEPDPAKTSTTADRQPATGRSPGRRKVR